MNKEININPKEFKDFIFEANTNGYAKEAKKISPQRPGFEETEYKNGDWYMRDSWCGHYFAPGQTVIYFKNQPIWTMAYSGGMKTQYNHNEKFTKQTIEFLRQALIISDKKMPLRGPAELKQGNWQYICTIKGDITDFLGNEKIYHQNKLVFEQDFIGGQII